MDAAVLVAMLSGWNDSGAGTLGQRLSLAMRHLIESGVLAAGDSLPAERALADALGVSRPTVSAVVADLRTVGLVESRQGSGSRISAGRAGPGWIDLATAAPFDAAHLGPVEIGTGDFLGVASSGPRADHRATLGLTSLRSAIAHRGRGIGRSIAIDEILVTSGAHQALAMVMAHHVPTGGSVIVESTTYPGLGDLVRSLGIDVAVVSRDAQGVDPEHLDALIGRRRPDLVVLVGPVHRPTGVLTTLPRLDRIAEVLDRHRVATLVDGVLDELSLVGAVADLRSRCGRAEVITVGSLSKAAWPGLGIGWIVASPAVVETMAVQRSALADPGPSDVSQLTAVAVLEGFDDMIEHRRHRLIRASEGLISWIGAALPDWTVRRPDGGLAIWVELPLDDARPYVDALARAGVCVASGSDFRPDGRSDPHIGICFDRPDYLIDEAVDRIVDTWSGR